MEKGNCLIEGAMLMQATMRGPAHPQVPAMEVTYALAREVNGQVYTCGKVNFASPPSFDQWPGEVQEKYLELVKALERHFINTGDLFEPMETRVHAVITSGAGDTGVPEEF